MIAYDLGYQCKTEAGTGGLGRHEWIEQVRQKVLRDARSVVLHAEFERQRHPRLAARQRQPHARPKRG